MTEEEEIGRIAWSIMMHDNAVQLSWNRKSEPTEDQWKLAESLYRAGVRAK